MEKRFHTMLVMALIASFFIAGCNFQPLVTGSENITEEELSYSGFSAIDLSHSFNAEILQADHYKVVIKYNANLKDYLDVKKDGNTLKIGLDEEHQYRNVKLSVIIYMPDIDEISASGACKVNFPGFNTNDLKISLSGASQLKAKFEILNNLKIESSGASDIALQGKAKNVVLSFSGASGLKDKGMIISNNLSVESSGASSITLTADGEISLNLSGASEFNYYGMGKVVKSNSSGASTIRKIERDSM
jgi:hypothetical protein